MVQIQSEIITSGHGSGGRMTQQLTKRILNHFKWDSQDQAKIQNELQTKLQIDFQTKSQNHSQSNLNNFQNNFQMKFQMEDCAFIGDDFAVSMDGFTVSPQEFPGGDIGKLAVCGSANDLAVRGVRPLYLTLSLIIEEGLDLNTLDRYMQSAAITASEGGIELVAGDTKVVGHGAADKIFITTCALGKRKKILPTLNASNPKSLTSSNLQASNLQEGDALIISTSPGRHGAALAAARFGIKAPELVSDCALLWPALEPLLNFDGLRCMRDCTRGGLGTVLCEWAEATKNLTKQSLELDSGLKIGLGIEIFETSIPVNMQVKTVCDILGFDPLYLASEGCVLVAVAHEQAEACLKTLRQNPLCADAAIIGHTVCEHPCMVGMKTQIGGLRFVDMPTGEILPRIC